MRIMHLLCAACVLAGCFSAHGKNLGGVVAESEAEWLIGHWSASDNAGVAVSFEWTLDKHVILVSFSSGDTQARGMITYRAGKEDILYVSADNKGGTGTGHWSIHNGHPTLFYEHHKPDGDVTKAGFLHKRVDDDTLSIEIYEIDDAGELASSPIAAPRFARKKQ
jgi:hypothetical protein